MGGKGTHFCELGKRESLDSDFSLDIVFGANLLIQNFGTSPRISYFLKIVGGVVGVVLVGGNSPASGNHLSLIYKCPNWWLKDGGEKV